MSVVQPSSRPADLNAIKERQHGAWSSGDYALIGSTLQIVGEQLCEALDVRAGHEDGGMVVPGEYLEVVVARK